MGMAGLHGFAIGFTINVLVQRRNTRRIELPADWMVSVSPAQVSLAPGEQTTVTVTVAPGSLTPQNTIPRVAVEGYAGNEWLGGVVIGIVVPRYVAFAPHRVYLPLAQKGGRFQVSFKPVTYSNPFSQNNKE